MFYGRAAGDYGKGGTPPKRNDRYEQMTKQQELIEQKKREIRLKLEAEKQRKEMELLMKKAGAPNKSTVVGRGVSSSSSSSTNKQSSSSSSTPQDDENSGKKTVDVEVKKPSVVPNAFANDGSFLEQFRKMQEEQQRKKAEEEAKKATASPKIKEEPEDSNISEYGGGSVAATVKIPPKPTIKILNAPVRSSSPADSNNSNSSQVSSSGSRNSMNYVPPPNIYNQSNQNQFAPPANSPPPPLHQQTSTASIKVEPSTSEYGSHSQDRDRYYPRDSRGDHQNQNQNVGAALPPPPPPPPPAQGHPQHAGGFPSQVVRQLAQQVAEFGDHIEEMARVENESDPLMWFLYRPDSAEYARYRGLVGQYQREGNSNSHQNNFRDAVPSPSAEYGGSGSMSMEASQSSSKRRNNNSSSSDEDNEYGGGMSERERRRNRKRRSRWGDRAESDQNSPPSPPPGTFDLGGPRGGGAPQNQSPPPPSGGPGPGTGSFNNDHNHPGVHNFRQNNQHPPHTLSGGFSNANNTPLGPPPPGYNMNNPNNQPLGPPGVSDYNPPGPQLPVQRMLLPQGIRPPHPGMMGMGMGGQPHIGMGRGGVPPPPGMGGNYPPPPQSHNQFMMGGPPRPPPPMPPGMQIPPSQQQPWGSMGFKEEMSAYGNTNEMQGSSSSLTGGGGDIKPLVPPTTLGTFPLLQNFNPDSKEPPALQKVTRHNPQLLAYAQQAYGNTNLDEEQWKQCEEAYKMNLVFQDIARKKAKDKKLEAEGKFKHEYDSDEEIDGGTWEHKQRMKEMEKTRDWATDLTSKAKGKHHIGDFLPPAELAKFMEKYKAVKEGRELDSSDYQEFKIAESNVGFKMLQKMGWTDGQGLGTTGQGIVAPIEKGNAVSDKQGLGQEKPDDLTEEDDEYTAYRKRMMLAYRFRPNPLNNPRRAYY